MQGEGCSLGFISQIQLSLSSRNIEGCFCFILFGGRRRTCMFCIELSVFKLHTLMDVTVVISSVTYLSTG